MFNNLFLLYLLFPADTEVKSNEKVNKYYFHLTHFVTHACTGARLCIYTHTHKGTHVDIFFREFIFIFRFFFNFFMFGLTGLRGISVSTHLHRLNESAVVGLLGYCVEAQRKRHTPTGPILLLKTALERGTVFVFVSPRANSVFLQNYIGQQGLKPALHREKCLREDGKRGYVDTRFSSQMEAFHVGNAGMPAQLVIGTLCFFPYSCTYSKPSYARMDEKCNRIPPDKCLSRKTFRETFN